MFPVSIQVRWTKSPNTISFRRCPQFVFGYSEAAELRERLKLSINGNLMGTSVNVEFWVGIASSRMSPNEETEPIIIIC